MNSAGVKTPAAPAVIEMRGICKTFGDAVANVDVDFTLLEGEIHALLGENGAGKSTLMNLLYGIYGLDRGSISIRGEEVEVTNPRVAIRHGVGMVHQHFMLIPQLTAAQNIFLGLEEARGILRQAELNRKVSELNDKYRFNVNPETLIWQMPVGTQQKVEILKVLMRQAKILIMDEPTAVLTPQEADDLFVSLKRLSGQGISIVLITHKLNEVMQYCDRVTVMREGRVVGTADVADTDADELTTLMVGREVSLTRNVADRKKGEVLLALKNVSVRSDKGLVAVKDVSFELEEGEILGIAGVDGNGQMELGEAISGLRPLTGGTITIGGRSFSQVKVSDMIEGGLGHIPDDRHRKGLIMTFSAEENLILGSQRSVRFNRGYFVNRKAIRAEATRLMEEYDVRPRNAEQKAQNFSGGNQQKIILAREVDRDPKVLLAVQPTRGLDVGATEFVHQKLLEMRKKGAGVLLISTDLDEIRALSDRIAVMYNGEIVGIVPHDAPLSRIGLMMAGVPAHAGDGAENGLKEDR